MNHRILCLCIAMSLLALGCSDNPAGPAGSSVTLIDILNAPVGVVEVDGQYVTMQGAYYVSVEGEPLRVLGLLSDRNLAVERLWFVSGCRLDEDDDPEECFNPSALCVSHLTRLEYRRGIKFVVALDFRDTEGGLVRVRSGLIEVVAPPWVRAKLRSGCRLGRNPPGVTCERPGISPGFGAEAAATRAELNIEPVAVEGADK